MTPHLTAREICQLGPVLPVLVVENVADAVPLATALLKGGIRALEVTLRTKHALDVIREMATVDGAIIGAGTVMTPHDLDAVQMAGAQFSLSPGGTQTLKRAATASAMPFIPGAATASEVMAHLEDGYDVQKFFPAEINGGMRALKAIGSPIPQVQFCPTGGVTQDNAAQYLALKNTLCVGGSWIAPATLIAEKNWSEITARAAMASAMTA
ncbi:MAG: bifunctional 4-hydroxy-2-oxoglutarate aldolase/2-dehydro-3-deoxy-phosphogluconate aldolase [Halocynthiibacter sp.]